ncbi:MAG: toll/interleukin-1 receptor domain-containing protein, partial [Ktedonobacterales bacterium]
MATGRASTSSASAARRGVIVWLALGWLVFVAWLALLVANAAPYLAGRLAPSAGELLARLIALPAALHLPAAMAASAAWAVAALAPFIGVVTLALTISSLRRETAPVEAPPASAPAIPAPPLTATPAAPFAEPASTPSVAPAVASAATPAPTAAARPAPAPTASPRIFISHSSADKDFGLKLERELKQALGDNDAVFYDSDGGLRGGDQWPQRLQQELGERTVFVLILSPQAAQSAWVRKEWNYALMQATSIGGKIIVPVMRQETPLWPFLTDLQVIDFTDPARFDAAFADLLVAVRLGRSRQAQLVGPRGVRRGPPFDLDKLPLQERFIGRDSDIEWALERLAPDLSLQSLRVVDVGNGRLGS